MLNNFRNTKFFAKKLMTISNILWKIFLQLTHMKKKKGVAWQHLCKINFCNKAKIVKIWRYKIFQYRVALVRCAPLSICLSVLAVYPEEVGHVWLFSKNYKVQLHSLHSITLCDQWACMQGEAICINHMMLRNASYAIKLVIIRVRSTMYYLWGCICLHVLSSRSSVKPGIESYSIPLQCYLFCTPSL